MLPVLHIEKTFSALLCDAELFSRTAAETANREVLETDALARARFAACLCALDPEAVRGAAFPCGLARLLARAGQCFLHLDGVHLRTDRESAELFSALSRHVHPFAFAAAYLVCERAAGRALGNSEWFERVSEQITEAMFGGDERKPGADLHCHAGGACDNCEILFGALAGGYKTDLKRRDEFPPCVFRDVLERSRGAPCAPEIAFMRSFDALNRALYSGKPLGKRGVRLDSLRAAGLRPAKILARSLFDLNLLPVERRARAETFSCELFLRAAKQHRKKYFGSALFLHFCAQYARILETGDAGFAREAWKFLLSADVFRSALVMSRGRTLKDFVRFYSNPLKSGNGGEFRGESAAEFMNGVRLWEAKSGWIPSRKEARTAFSEMLHTLMRRCPEYALREKGGVWSRFVAPHQDEMKFCRSYHFIKKLEYVDAPKSDGGPAPRQRHSAEYRDVEKRGRELRKFLREECNVVRLDRLFADDFPSPADTRELKRCHCDLRALLRTLDAAGDERLFPPEVFVPMIRALRKGALPQRMSPGFDVAHLRPMKVSMHAGECFESLSTGMRRVDELTEFGDLCDGDRIGHALAAGVDPRGWADAHEECVVTLEDFFDDAVWLRRVAREAGSVFPDAFRWTSFYEERIRRWAPELYSARALTMARIRGDFFEVLERAWLLRRNWPRAEKLFPQDGWRRALCPDFRELRNEKNPAVMLYREYLESTAYRRKARRKIVLRRRELGIAHGERGGSVVELGEKELDFWKAVQDCLIEKCVRRGVVFETNPSSNVFITDLSGYDAHPIFRWRPVRAEELNAGEKYNRFGLRHGPVRVCVNTDDPAIFNTGILKEFALLSGVAERMGYAKGDIETWIEALRVAGTEIFEENYISPFSALKG
ncbi:MAG: hypothetical protein ACI4QA_00575 [Candidatus Spyradosoma sp.]